MASPATSREQRLRKTKAQLIDEIERLEQPTIANKTTDGKGTPASVKMSDPYLAGQDASLLARFPSENPNPVLMVLPDGTVLYANDAAIAVKGLFKGGKKATLTRDITNVVAEVSRTAQVREAEFESGNCIIAFSMIPVTGETYINIYGRDVTDRRHATAELEDSAQRLQLVLRGGDLGFWDTDFETGHSDVNERWADILGYTLDEIENNQQLWRETIHPDDRGWMLEMGRRYRDGEESTYEGEYRAITKQGETKWLLMKGAAVKRNKNGKAIRMAGTVMDITERKRAERELTEKEAHLRVVLDYMPGGIALEDRNLKYVLFNARYSELLDYPDGLASVGGSLRDTMRYQAERGDFGPGDKDDLIEQVVATYQRGKAVSYERMIADSGRTLRFNVAPTPDGGCVTIVTNITKRKRAEQELVEKEAQLRVALDNMPGSMSLVDKDWNYVFFNSQYIELHDYPDGLLKIGGSVLDETRFQAERGDYGPGDPEKLMVEARLPFRSSEPKSYERTLPGGRTLNFNVAPTPEGGYVTIATDITERKRAEQELVQKEAHLRAALDNMPGGIRLIDSNRNFVLSNQQYIDLYDLPEGLLKVGDSIRVENLYCARRGDLGSGDPEAMVDEWLAKAPEQTARQSWEYTSEDGKVLQVNTAPLPDRGVVNVVTDITERKRAETELAEKEAQLRVALENMPGGMTLCDQDWNYVFFNSQYSELHDYPDGLIKVGGSANDETRFQAERGDFGPGDPDELIQQVDAPYMSDDPESYERTLPNGRTLHFNVARTPDRGYVTIATEITERKRAEEQLQAAHTRLGQFSEAVSEYLDPMLVDNLRNGSDVEPRVHFVTVYFADLVGSTRLSREMNADSFGTMIQKFVGEMQRVIKAHRGYLEDISGDGIFGYIGNFDSRGSESDAAEAIGMALKMQLRLADLSTEFQSRYGLSEPLRMRFGISSGNALVGKTAGVRAIYTANGDIVNLGAKLEQKLRDLTDAGGILISEQTAALVEGHFALDRHIVNIEGQEMGAYLVDPAQSSISVL